MDYDTRQQWIDVEIRGGKVWNSGLENFKKLKGVTWTHWSLFLFLYTLVFFSSKEFNLVYLQSEQQNTKKQKCICYNKTEEI